MMNFVFEMGVSWPLLFELAAEVPIRHIWRAYFVNFSRVLSPFSCFLDSLAMKLQVTFPISEATVSRL